ncbi:hypothetical protein A3B42_02430 [Candidatus Daviesbacteria bacterium RIFCSPLOWO2_01_FULL_38_10]|nr:MAG: hypothetical protein A3B42_02430 [Candidatus Daviesbacteria bacterium RIFCSPLOWO2_01_FULL_38_10]OGE73508.1 MAG: hypothetical protein A3H18_05815 [Candidatus Daviesbacteria bacterium RIFCSPLOWO2_12_FULL_38_10]
MSQNRESDELLRANREIYGTPDLVKQYMQYPYQQMRCEIALKLLHEALASPVTPEGALLELGTSSHSIVNAASLANDGRHVIYADIETSPLAALYENQQSKNSSFVLLDASRPLPVKDTSLAAVIAGELIEHLFDPIGLLKEAERILRPGGILVVTTPNTATFQDRMRFPFGGRPRQLDRVNPHLRLHISHSTPSSLRKDLKSTGFELLSFESNFVRWYLASGRWVDSRKLAQIFPDLGGVLIMSARKPTENLQNHR